MFKLPVKQNESYLNGKPYSITNANLNQELYLVLHQEYTLEGA